MIRKTRLLIHRVIIAFLMLAAMLSVFLWVLCSLNRRSNIDAGLDYVMFPTFELPGLNYVFLIDGWMVSANLEMKMFFIPYWMVVAIWLAYPLVAFIRGPFRLYRRRRGGLCLKCGYDLRGLGESRCPECFTEFDPNSLPELPRS